MSKTLGLALGCGGSRGMAHAGILVALEEAGIKPDYVTGCSIGSVIGACYASGITAHEIRDVALNLKTRDILDFTPAFLHRMSLLRSKKVEDLLYEHLGDASIEDFPIRFGCVATDLLSGKLREFTSGPAVLAVQASCAIPAVFRPIEHKNMLLVDGGCLCRVPVRTLKNMGADVIIAVDVLSNVANPVDRIGNILSLVLRMFDLMESHQTKMRTKIEGEIADLVLKPVIENVSPYAIKDLERMYEIGYKLGKKNVDKIRNLIK